VAEFLIFFVQPYLLFIFKFAGWSQREQINRVTEVKRFSLGGVKIIKKICMK